jgi:hypothetical protein
MPSTCCRGATGQHTGNCGAERLEARASQDNAIMQSLANGVMNQLHKEFRVKKVVRVGSFQISDRVR